MTSQPEQTVREHAIVEVARALYWLDTGHEAEDDQQALASWAGRATAAVETMQRLGWHHA